MMPLSPKKPKGLGPYACRSIGLSPFTPGPYQLPDRQEPTPTFQSSNGRTIFRSSQIHTPACFPFGRGCGLSGRCHPITLTSDSTPNAYSHLGTSNHQTGGCTRFQARTSTTLPLPIDSSGTQQGADAWYICLSSTDRLPLQMHPFREYTLAG